MIAAGTPQATPGTRPSKGRVHAVYDRTTGLIVHIHHTVAFEGEAPAGEAPETRALRMAGRSAGEVAIVEIDPIDPRRRQAMRIDPASGRIIPAERT